jgi:transposase InsO family protein
MKYLVIQKYHSKYSIKKMCEFFEVSRSGYYDFLKLSEKEDKDKWLADMILECQSSCSKTYGYRRVQIWLERKKGIRINHKAVLRVMNKYNLLAEIRRKQKYSYSNAKLHRYDNLLNRDFNAERPNQKWVTDISYIYSKEGVLYLSMIRDLFDNSIVAYKTSTVQSTNLVLRTINSAMDKEKVTDELQLHSDQGFQYTSYQYFNLTKEYGITPSMSRRGNCLDNAMAENFFGILKSECIRRFKPRSLNEARKMVDEYIYFYNHERIQLKTKQTPLEKRHLFMVS